MNNLDENQLDDDDDVQNDAVIASASVEAALRQSGVIDKALSTKSAQRATQDACNRWMDESGRSLTVISRVLALSTDA